MISTLATLGGALAALAVLALLVLREVRRVASASVARPAALVVRGRRVRWTVELVLWSVAVGLLVPRIVELLV